MLCDCVSASAEQQFGMGVGLRSGRVRQWSDAVESEVLWKLPFELQAVISGGVAGTDCFAQRTAARYSFSSLARAADLALSPAKTVEPGDEMDMTARWMPQRSISIRSPQSKTVASRSLLLPMNSSCSSSVQLGVGEPPVKGARSRYHFGTTCTTKSAQRARTAKPAKDIGFDIQ